MSSDGAVQTDVRRFASLERRDRELLLHVYDLMGSILYGTVVLVLHQGSVVQIETSEKFRLR